MQRPRICFRLVFGGIRCVCCMSSLPCALCVCVFYGDTKKNDLKKHTHKTWTKTRLYAAWNYDGGNSHDNADRNATFLLHHYTPEYKRIWVWLEINQMQQQQILNVQRLGHGRTFLYKVSRTWSFKLRIVIKIKGRGTDYRCNRWFQYSMIRNSDFVRWFFQITLRNASLTRHFVMPMMIIQPEILYTYFVLVGMTTPHTRI